MNFPLDISIDKEPFQYVINIIKGKDDPYISPDGMVRIFPSMIKLTMPDDALFIFQERYNSGEIPCQYRYEDYIADKDLQATIKGLNLTYGSKWVFFQAKNTHSSFYRSKWVLKPMQSSDNKYICAI